MTRMVSPTPTRFRAVAWIPQGRLSATFSRALARFPIDTRIVTRLAPLRFASFACFEAFLLSRVRSHRDELPRRSGRYSPGLQPLQSVPSRTSETSLTHPVSRARARARDP
jgi:hypothetical protein